MRCLWRIRLLRRDERGGQHVRALRADDREQQLMRARRLRPWRVDLIGIADGFGRGGTGWRLNLDGKIAGGLVGGEMIDVNREFAVTRDGDQLQGIRQSLRTRGAGSRDRRRRGAVVVPLMGRRG